MDGSVAGVYLPDRKTKWLRPLIMCRVSAGFPSPAEDYVGDKTFERSHRVMKAMDEINKRHGHDIVRFGVVQPEGRWQTKCLRRSQNYTTSLKEVLCIK